MKFLYKWIWLGLFSMTFFSEAQFPYFNPYAFYPSPLQPTYPLPQQSPLMLLCPPHVHFSLCLSQTSFNGLQQNRNGSMKPFMMTPMIQNFSPVSSTWLNRTLSKGGYKSYEYSGNRYKPISLKRRKKILRRKGNSSFLHTNGHRVIKEEWMDGQFRAVEGDLVATSTEDVINNTSPISNPESSNSENENSKSSNSENENSENENPESLNPENENPESSEEHVIVTHRPINTVRIQMDSGKRDSGKMDSRKTCTNFDDIHTEAMDQCAECEVEKLDIKNFKELLQGKIKSTVCIGGIDQDFTKDVKRNFQSQCKPSDFLKYVRDDVICKACKAKVPPALMLSIMYLENSGKCNVQGDGGNSKGPFQIYQKFHEKRIEKICPRVPASKCLSNPQTSLDVSLDIVGEYYSSLTGGKTPSFECSGSSLIKDPDNWRKALAAYNAGPSYISNLKKKIKRVPKGISESKWSKMSDWEKMRFYYFKDCKDNPKCLLNNLAYVEAGLGNVNSKHPSILQKWEESAEILGIKNLNNDKHCNK